MILTYPKRELKDDNGLPFKADYVSSSIHAYPLGRQISNGHLCVSSLVRVIPETMVKEMGSKFRYELGWKRPLHGGWDIKKYPFRALVLKAPNPPEIVKLSPPPAPVYAERSAVRPENLAIRPPLPLPLPEPLPEDK